VGVLISTGELFWTGVAKSGTSMHFGVVGRGVILGTPPVKQERMFKRCAKSTDLEDPPAELRLESIELETADLE
jgi:hypothetical protein